MAEVSVFEVVLLLIFAVQVHLFNYNVLMFLLRFPWKFHRNFNHFS